MTTLLNLLGTPSSNISKNSQYLLNNSNYECFSALTYIMNPSVVTNADFSTLGSHGQSPITTDTDISSTWNILGASNASFIVTSASYPSNSTIPSGSNYYINLVCSSFNGSDFFIYQNQPLTVRKYQNNKLTYTIIINNNQNKIITVRNDIFFYYDTASETMLGKSIYLQPGLNIVTSTISTPSLSGLTVGSSPYTQFRLRFLDFGSPSTANIDIYQIKCEFGTIGTLLQQQ